MNVISVDNEPLKLIFFVKFTNFLFLKVTKYVTNKSIFFTHVEHGVLVYQNKSKRRQNKLPLLYPNMFLKHY